MTDNLRKAWLAARERWYQTQSDADWKVCCQLHAKLKEGDEAYRKSLVDQMKRTIEQWRPRDDHDY